MALCVGISDFPDDISDFPESISDFPEGTSDVPESISDFPDEISAGWEGINENCIERYYFGRVNSRPLICLNCGESAP